MKTADFDFALPKKLIAQKPLSKPEAARLMVVRRTAGTIAHKHFSDLPALLRAGDVLVFNDSRVIPARLFGTIDHKKVEILLLESRRGVWEVLAKPGRKFIKGVVVDFSAGKTILRATVLKKTAHSTYKIRFAQRGRKFDTALEKIGVVPLPPYITRQARMQEYQNVFARRAGSAAAPTAGLHFSNALLGKLKEHGVQLEFVTLHVGLGTFQPVKSETLAAHHMHSERYYVAPQTARRLNAAKREGRRIVAVGTTSLRVLESLADRKAHLAMRKGWQSTDIFITPSYRFRFVDALITNFHLPKSTLFMLVAAFTNLPLIKKAYRSAVRHGYRFFSFGDGMFLH